MSGAYISNLPSTPVMQRYTSAPSSVIQPTTAKSPTSPWVSSLSGCSSCGLGADDATGVSPFIGGVLGLVGVYALKSRPSSSEVALGFIGGMTLAKFVF